MREAKRKRLIDKHIAAEEELEKESLRKVEKEKKLKEKK